MGEALRIGVVGVGAVGEELLRILPGSTLTIAEIRPIARSARTLELAGRTWEVKEIGPEVWRGLDLALFAGTEGERGAGARWARELAGRGLLVVDNGADFRLDPDVPLVVPEVNPKALDRHQGLVANPNCTTVQLVHALAPLHREAGLREVVVTAFQSVSGSGRAAVAELRDQVRDAAAGVDLRHQVYPEAILGNLLPWVGEEAVDLPGSSSEEIKLLRESRKILDLPTLPVAATCVRVPVERGHALAVTARFEEPITVGRARALLSGFPGLALADAGDDPTPRRVAGTDATRIGRLRQPLGAPDTLALWVVADNLRKGAALNAVQIAETALARGLLPR